MRGTIRILKLRRKRGVFRALSLIAQCFRIGKNHSAHCLMADVAAKEVRSLRVWCKWMYAEKSSTMLPSLFVAAGIGSNDSKHSTAQSDSVFTTLP